MKINNRLLILIPTLGNGGAERQMVQLIKFLNELNIIPSIILYSNVGKEYEENIEVNRISLSNSTFGCKYIKVLYHICKIYPDIILSFGQIPNVLAIISSIFVRKMKVVVSERNSTIKYDILHRLLFSIYRFSDYIIVNSICQTNFMKFNAKYLNSKIVTITNFTDIKRYMPNSYNRNNVLKIGVFARYHPQKNTLLFLDMINLLNKIYKEQIVFHWYGENYLNADNSPTKYSQYYNHCIVKKNKLHLSNVFLHGHTTVVDSKMKEMDLICLPSLTEGFSNVLSEALCLGKPILASDVGDNSSFVTNNTNGYLFDPNDLNSMISSFEKMLSLSDIEFNCFSTNSRKLAEQLFSKELFVQSYLKVLFGTV